MKTVLAIAKNTFKQVIRDKLLYGILIFALLFMGSITILSSLSLGEDLFIIKSFGLAGIYIFGLIITLFLGASLIYDEVERKTSYFLLSKPVSRTDIIKGKFLGLLLAIGATTLLMAAAYLLILILNGQKLDYLVFLSASLQFFEMTILISFLILFSVFTTPLAAMIYTVLIVYIGHSLNYIIEYSSKAQTIQKYILMTVYYIFPNLEKFNIRNLAAHNISISENEVLISAGYALIYMILILYTAQALFNRRDL